MALFSIDGEEFNISLVDVDRSADFLHKYANRVEGGDLLAELIGVYYNYTLTFPNLNIDVDEYDRLWRKVTEPVEFHDFIVPSSDGTFAYRGYISGVKDKLIRVANGKNYWGGLTIKLLAKAPARVPGEV